MPLVTRNASTKNLFVQATQPADLDGGWIDSDDSKMYALVNGTATQVGKLSFSSAAVVTHSTTIGDYSAPTAAVATSEATLTADITDDCSSDNFTDNDSAIQGVSAGALTWNFVRDGSVNTTVRDCTSMLDASFTFRCKLVVTTVTAGSESHYGFIGLTDLTQTSDLDAAGDRIGLRLTNTAGGTKAFVAVATNGAGVTAPTVSSTFATALAAGTYYLEIKRTSLTSVTVSLYSNSGFTTLTEAETLTVTSGYTGLRYIAFQNWNQTSGTGVLLGTADDFSLWKTSGGAAAVATNSINTDTTSIWQSTSGANPAIYVDCGGSAINIMGCAIYLHANTTETEIKIRADTDTTFADANNVRTITVTNLTAGAWNYIRFNIKNVRYLQIYGSSGTAKVLAISEIKYLTKTDTQILADLGVLEISGTATSLALDGT
jgi:hypothetical protein